MDGFFGIGLLELFLIAILALIVLGPERLPGAMRQIANYIREIRRMGSELTSQFSEELQVLDELNPKRLIDEMTDPNYDEKKAKAGAKSAPKPAAKPAPKPATKPATPAKPLASPPASPPAAATAAAAAAAATTETTGPEAGDDAPAAALNGGENTIMPPQPPPSEPAPTNGTGDPPAPEPLTQAETPRAAEQADEQQ